MASAAVTNVPIDYSPDPSSVGLNNHVTNDIEIAFTGQYSGSQLLISLDSGGTFTRTASATISHRKVHSLAASRL
jgi:hypothetical protein